MSHEEPAKTRLILLLVLPPLLAGILVYLLLSIEFNDRAADRQQQYGQSTANQLSRYLAQHVVENDVLSLNVVATGLVDNEYIGFVAVYDDANTVIAQSGRDNRGMTSFTSEIAFQDSVVGFVRVALVDEKSPGNWWLVVLAFLLTVPVLVIWQRPHALTSWLYAESKVATEVDKPSDVEPLPDSCELEEQDYEECILVVRIRPAHYLERYFDKFFNAAELYKGIVEQTTPEELVIHFEGADAMFMATSAGMLIRQLAEQMHGNMTFGGTLDLVAHEPEKTRKSASYLASIAEGDLLIAGGESLLNERVELQTFHHSLVDSSDLRRISQPGDQALLDRQTRQLMDA